MFFLRELRARIRSAYARAIRVSLRACTRINGNAVSCVVCVRVNAQVQLNRKTRLRAKNRKTQTHFGFRNFQDVL